MRSLYLAVTCAVLFVGCGDDGGPEAPDAGVDATPDASPDAPLGECEGVPDGTACGDSTATACDLADTCRAGVCVDNLAAIDTACGDATDSECDAADTCDGAGACRPNLAAADTACGDATDTECNGADTCDGAGTCQDNLAAAMSACGDPSDSECDGADTCDGAGTCEDNLAPAMTTCGDPASSACNGADTCNGAGACLDNLAPAMTACGDPTATDCNGADTCNGAGACLDNLAPAMTACGDATVSDCDAADTCNGAGTCTPNTVVDGTACYDCDAGTGACDVCMTGTCDDGPGCLLGPTASLATTFGAGNNHRGNMFDVTVVAPIAITGFDVHPMGNTSIEIFYRTGTYVGFETSAAGWTQILVPTPVTAQPFGTGTRVDLTTALSLTAGQTYAFYVTSASTAVSLNYTDGSSEGAVYTSDANLQIRQGVGMEYPFTAGTNNVFRPRVWNGRIHYRDAVGGDTLSTVATPHVGSTVDGAMFDVEATSDVALSSVEVELIAGTHDVDIYFRRGAFDGFTSSVTGWERIGGVTAVSSVGGGSRTLIFLEDAIEMSAGETVAVYVDTGIGADALRVDPGTTVGATAVSTAHAELLVGRSIDGSFGTTGPAATARAVIGYGVCFVTP